RRRTPDHSSRGETLMSSPLGIFGMRPSVLLFCRCDRPARSGRSRAVLGSRRIASTQPRPQKYGSSVAVASAAAAVAPAAAVASFVHLQRATVQLVSVELLNRLLRLGVRGHLDETETARLTGIAVGDDRHGLASAGRGEQRLEVLIGGGEGKIADVQLL